MWLSRHKIVSFLIVCLALGAIGFLNLKNAPTAPASTFLYTLVLNVVVLLVIGTSMTGYGFGIFLDGRNRVSLSRFQVVVWTVIVFSAVVTLAGYKISQNAVLGLKFEIPIQLLAAMGISVVSAVAAPAILSQKNEGTAKPADVEEAATKLGIATSEVKPLGKLFGRVDGTTASIGDMFRGEEVSDASTADLSKIQQFLVTMLLAAVYTTAVFTAFNITGVIEKLPELSNEFVGLLGISHLGYLSTKAVSKPEAA